MEIIEPAMISLTVPNKDYVNAVEACFNITQLKTFVAQCDDDYRLLNQLVSDTVEALGKKVRITTWFRPVEGNIAPPPMTLDEAHSLGFDGYAIDFVECPQAMRAFLQRECQLHRTAIALQTNRVDTARTMEAISRAGGGNYIVSNTMNMVTRSQYGRRLPQNLTRDVRPARILVGPVVDPAARQKIESMIAQSRDKLTVHAEEARRLGDIERQVSREQKEYKDAFVSLQHLQLYFALDIFSNDGYGISQDALKARKLAVLAAKKRMDTLENKLAFNKAGLRNFDE
ncbi:hypothetical protein B0F90DRAFT_184176 [Multifurca ochricompacta]|uniref:Uncharacterized protein n=1 Tax=Multifurca ochricompacta TaxID=376703 RepID=A0AAD4M665_9AGAM|nr:hypothetical protein B0F90DRAFT_184176 [Multifurca ochricompacta]